MFHSHTPLFNNVVNSTGYVASNESDDDDDEYKGYGTAGTKWGGCSLCTFP